MDRLDGILSHLDNSIKVHNQCIENEVEDVEFHKREMQALMDLKQNIKYLADYVAELSYETYVDTERERIR